MKKLKINKNFLLLLLLSLLFVFTRGTVLGDQEKILSFVYSFEQSESSIYEFIFKNNGQCDFYDKCNFNYLHHHLFWFFYLFIINNFINFFEIFLNINLYSFERELFISIFDTFIFILAFFF